MEINCIACGPVTQLIQLDPVSGTLAGEILFDSKAASKLYQGVINTDILLGGKQGCEPLIEVVYEGPNFVEPIIFRVSPRTTDLIVAEMHKSQNLLISRPGHGGRVHAHMVNWASGPI